MGIEVDKGFLWRLTFIKLKNETDNLLNNFCLIFTAHHAIIYGKGCFYTIYQLLNILENTLLQANESIQSYKNYEILQPIENLIPLTNSIKTKDLEKTKEFHLPSSFRQHEIIMKNSKATTTVVHAEQVNGTLKQIIIPNC